MMHAITVAMTGASGAIYGLRLVECLLRANKDVAFLLTKPAHIVIATETSFKLPTRSEAIRDALCERFGAPSERLHVYGQEQWSAPIASGSNTAAAMVVCPCTSSTLSAIAAGSSDNLLERAADVMIKERRQLILVPRETPLSPIHLENMLKLARIGVTILPACPGLYHNPTTVLGVIDFVVARVLDHLGVAHALLPRWGADEAVQE